MNPNVATPADHAAVVFHYFPVLSAKQMAQLDQLGELYRDWNTRLNLISRKDMDHFYLHHVLHALSIAKVVTFCADTQILDWGTGGGFPGIPLAILFPEVDFHLVDSIGKKIKVLRSIVETLGLKNITLSCTRAETLSRSYDFVVGRSVVRLMQFYRWAKGKVIQEQKNSLRNGIFYLTGPPTLSLHEMERYALRQFFQESYFHEKYLVYIACT